MIVGDQLTKLNELRKEGVLSEEEFQAQKKALLKPKFPLNLALAISVPILALVIILPLTLGGDDGADETDKGNGESSIVQNESPEALAKSVVTAIVQENDEAFRQLRLTADDKEWVLLNVPQAKGDPKRVTKWIADGRAIGRKEYHAIREQLTEIGVNPGSLTFERAEARDCRFRERWATQQCAMLYIFAKSEIGLVKFALDDVFKLERRWIAGDRIKYRGIVSSTTVETKSQRRRNAMIQVASSHTKLVAVSANAYWAEWSKIPTLKNLVSSGFIEDAEKFDPWGTQLALRFTMPNRTVRVCSWGPNGKRGGDDDICHPRSGGIKPAPPELSQKMQQVKTEGRPVMGSLDAAMHLVEFADYGSPHCRDLFERLHELWKSRKTKVKLSVLNFPLINCHEARGACFVPRAAECSFQQGAYAAFSERAFKLGAMSPVAQVEQLPDIIKELGLDEHEFTACMDAEETIEKIIADRRHGLDLGVTGTPTLFLNGRRMSNAATLADLEKMVDELASEKTR